MPSTSRRVIVCAACQGRKQHSGRGLCSTCYKKHHVAGTLEQFPLARVTASPREHYDGWVVSELSPREYARQLGIWETSLVRALRIERERRDRLGLPWLTGWRKVRGGYNDGPEAAVPGERRDLPA